jgi:hypothetical protein
MGNASQVFPYVVPCPLIWQFRHSGLQELQASLSATENAMTRLRQQFAEAKKGWSFDVQHYLSSGSYAKEVMAAAQQMGVSMFERDDRLYCYPALLRVPPTRRR